MNEIVSLNSTQTMSSLLISELTGKNHSDVMRSIRKMEPAWEKINGRKFALVASLTTIWIFILRC